MTVRRKYLRFSCSSKLAPAQKKLGKVRLCKVTLQNQFRPIIVQYETTARPTVRIQAEYPDTGKTAKLDTTHTCKFSGKAQK